MKILQLEIKDKWFNLIRTGEKTEVFLECTLYWESRFVENGKGKHFDIVRFYNKDKKESMIVEFKGISFTGKEWVTPKHGEVLTGDVIVIKLGDVLNKNETNLYQNLAAEFKDDPQFKAQCVLADLTGCICEINPSQKLPVRVLIRIIEWCAEKAIYRRKE